MIKQAKIFVYSKIYTWALNKWRNQVTDPNFKHVSIKVSNHALMRYAERIDGYDFESVREKILNDIGKDIKEMGGDGKLTVNGVMYIVVNKKVLTCFKPQGAKANLVKETAKGRLWSF